ncbi:hypothetical protein LNJ05_12225 [Tenacibaculum finnmarkense genomovar ulcerans]|uniref:hypothetical protein n=1 Tax=Tenacibaculum finnmarkense TaxID=2781243 RepID=UPI001E3E4A6F|nr:hypothetical protein [Tenacibaculum finnmarkense]MCD8401471.1 hypothetical protein [Tenacibaculum finnmarkense genomovar ulcerans]MCD8433528.1 hypothetical protein [Tenacibaculum finnmarkense genomovar ulcerans]MCG8796622.1 hypothetical protein [Tenacibaculum finnmarkense]MCG8798954.1 hypothetical protein [Tenacibaculum finnmarkense]
MYFLRGLTSSYFIYERKVNIEKTKFSIEKRENGIYTFTFKNNSITPKYFLFYREGEIFLNGMDTLFFYGNRARVIDKKNISKIDLMFGCGNGLGITSINPYEKFQKDYSYEDILNEISYLGMISDYKNKDLLYGENLFSDEKELILNKKSMLNEIDSLEVQFYYGMYSVGENKQYPIKSNTIKIGYLDLIKNYIENELKYRNENN